MFKPSYLTASVLLALAGNGIAAETRLSEISVTTEISESAVSISEVTADSIAKANPSNIKQLFAQTLDIEVNNLQRSRGGNEGVNVRGLQGNRVEMTLDGIPLSEAQENKLFTTVGMAFGRGDFIEPTALRSAQVARSGSNSGLSANVNFSTLEPSDLLKQRSVAGLAATAYSSVDRSLVGTLAFAAQNQDYQGLVLTTLRNGHETQTQGKIGGVGASRTKADPADYKNGYVLVKNYYRLNEQHRLGLTFEYLQKQTDRNQLSQQGTISARGSSTDYLSDNVSDKVLRSRLSLSHAYKSDDFSADSVVYLQNSTTKNQRSRDISAAGRVNTRLDEAQNKDKIYGFNTLFSYYFDSAVPQILRIGAHYSYQDLTNNLITTSAADRKPSADTKQQRFGLYLEDEISLGQVVLTPHLGWLDYRLKPRDSNGYVQRASDYAPIQNQHKTALLPKFGIIWNLIDEFKPYAQYSRGYRAPSAQQLTTSFGNTRGTFAYSIVGNPQLKPETADNFELGFKGKNEQLQYRISGFYNRYKNFIDYQTMISNRTLMVIQYQNIAKAKIYGVEAEAKWQFATHFNLNGGVTYSRGRSTATDGTVRPINSIQPLKLRAGLGYDSENWGANLLFTHVRAKSDKDIDGTMYNPSVSYNLVDLGAYWQPVSGLTLSAGVNNLFDKTYWNWADLSHLAGRQNETAQSDSSVGTINASNAEAYSAPGRNFTLGVRYQF